MVVRMQIYTVIQKLLNEATERQLIEKTDEIYARNQILSLLNLESFEGKGREDACLFPESENSDLVIPILVDQIVAYAIENHVIEDFFDAKEIFAAKVMNCLVARPSEVNRNFYEKYREKPEEATNYFYQLSKNSNYIQMARINKNIEYKVATEFGDLDITINLSKPEKDPKQIALEKNKPKISGYPKCLLCIENEGYAGRIGHPARSNHRMIRIQMEGEGWNLQYSPYVYYNEHCILLSDVHRNMQISRETFKRLLAFVELFPHYFIGSNADLPIVGGSILSHDHYQGGNYDFPMALAENDSTFKLDRFPNVECSVVKWPMTVIRMKSDEKNALIELADYILSKWKQYSDAEAEILAFTEDTPHNTITPIARKKNGQFELDLVLRNNRTSDEHPLGIFHPHADVHHIKKENIGLIEVMGLAVLPSRLKDELKEVEAYLLNRPNQIANYHVPWALELKERYKEVSEENISQIVEKEVGLKFLRVLMDAGVYKRTSEGKKALLRFINSLND